MGRFWSILFLAVPVLGVGCFVCAAMSRSWPLYNHWFPRDISEHGHVIDDLFTFILLLTGLIFVATSLTLVYFLWKYDARQNAEPVKYTHGSHVLEVVWSILPAATLLFIAIYQMDAWAAAKMRRPMLPGPDGRLETEDDIARPPLAAVTGRQFEWRIAYAGADGVVGTRDDIFTVNDLHVPLGEEIVLEILSEDVLHSLFLPNVRLKQDLVPGMRQYVWFRPLETGTYDIVCAELCGWGHYKMKGRLTVLPRDQFDRWLAQKWAEQELSTYTAERGE